MASRRRSVRVVVTGHKAIDRKLRKLEPKIQRKLARKATREGLRPILDEVIASAPEDTGFLRDHVKLRAVRKKRRGEIALHVIIPSIPFKAAFGDSKTPKANGSKTTYFYPSIIEYGSRDRPPDPWVRRAFERLQGKGRQTMIDELWGAIEREASRGVRKPSGGSGGPRRDPTTGRFI
ncbi:HK97-gp10 family putative phage morphogenesis protein [Tautonia plasticadhaerens]|uniref:Phage protein, HK97 gp10 family n=1 Tax=Tautonia plasticadhaerens TaxID=2527974 RepID=A0A518GZL0_9BACT|nr:HK97-gp10 family putative phage morphogenesis protein [Tautonia plasticadhaerens]QDV34011.1 hypothetical protein ElP_18920 [Tautonia plasticadhaerens]